MLIWPSTQGTYLPRTRTMQVEECAARHKLVRRLLVNLENFVCTGATKTRSAWLPANRLDDSSDEASPMDTSSNQSRKVGSQRSFPAPSLKQASLCILCSVMSQATALQAVVLYATKRRLLEIATTVSCMPKYSIHVSHNLRRRQHEQFATALC